MRILYFSNDYCTHDHRFLSTIRTGGHEVYHVRLEANLRQTEDRPIPEGVEIVSWTGGKSQFHWLQLPRYVIGLKHVIKRLKPDLIHVGPIQTCAFITALTGFSPILTVSWGFDLMEYIHRGPWWRWVTRYVLQRSTFFTSDAQTTRDIAVEYGMNPDRTVIFPWGVNLDHFFPKKWPKNIQKEAFTLFCNRSWEPRYGVDILTRAFVKAARIRSDLDLMLLGGGSLGSQIRNILLNGDVLDRVTFGGQVSQAELPRWYHWADVYISPSHIDGSSVSLMEALACGLPCLVSDIPTNKEWITEGKNGWLFPDGEVDMLVEKILQIVGHRKSLPKMGRESRAIAEERANWEKNGAILLDTYKAIMKLI